MHVPTRNQIWYLETSSTYSYTEFGTRPVSGLGAGEQEPSNEWEIVISLQPQSKRYRARQLIIQQV